MAPVSYANLNAQNMELSPMRVTYKGVDLGGTLGNVVVKPEFQKSEIKADQLGETVLDRRVSGLMITVVTEIAEVKLKDNWKVVFPHAKLVDGGISGKSIYFQSMISDSDLSNSGALILHPLSLPDADKSGDFFAWKAVPIAASEVVYGPKEQTKLKITWNILPDTSVIPARFMIYGDPTIGLTAAVAAIPVFSGTGGGTLSSVAVFNGFTKTETITATCIHATTNGGRFDITGSVSGPLGDALVGSPFVSSVISFTINDGSPDFALNDTFTIATTGANYA